MCFLAGMRNDKVPYFGVHVLTHLKSMSDISMSNTGESLDLSLMWEYEPVPKITCSKSYSPLCHVGLPGALLVSLGHCHTIQMRHIKEM